MLIVPAIDIRDGKCVRLVQGDYDRETVFSADPAAMARRWLAEGARALHLVDLDGARSGTSDNRTAVEEILQVVSDHDGEVETELGGGIRDLAGVSYWLEAGVGRVILGTVAVTDPAVVEAAAARFPGRVWVGIDARQGRAAVDGWTTDTAVDAFELARRCQGQGAAGIVYTDIERDGTSGGINVEATARLAAGLSIPVFASGGVSSLGDIERLGGPEGEGIAGVIVGRALYDGTLALSDLLEAAA